MEMSYMKKENHSFLTELIHIRHLELKSKLEHLSQLNKSSKLGEAETIS